MFSEADIREVSGFAGYFARGDGTLWTRWTKGPMRRKRDNLRQIVGHRNKVSGYIETDILNDKGERCHVLVNWIIATAFHGPRPQGLQCRHIDGNRANNMPDNLAWGTQSDNEQDKKDHGRFNRVVLRGSENGSARLNECRVLEIVRRCNDGESRSSIAAELHVSRGSVDSIMSGRNWSWLTKISRKRVAAA
jgi:hypothetical protein